MRIHGKGGTVRTVLLDDRGHVTVLRLRVSDRCGGRGERRRLVAVWRLSIWRAVIRDLRIGQLEADELVCGMPDHAADVRFPDKVRRAAPIAGTAKITPHNAIFVESFIEAITSDPGFRSSYSACEQVGAGLARHARAFSERVGKAFGAPP